MPLRLIIIFALLTLMLVATRAQESSILITSGTYTGEITNEDTVDRYQFEGIAGQQVTIMMEAINDSSLDAALSLFDSSGILIQTDDDSGGNRNARIDFIPTTNGIFTIEATRYALNPPLTIGVYQLTLEILNTSPDNIDPLALAPQFGVPFIQISVDEIIPAAFTTGDDLQYYVIGAQQGDFIRAELTTNDNLQANIRILTRIDQTLVEISRATQSDDSAEIIFATITQTGWYLIEVERESGIGGYTLSPSLVSDTLLSVDTPIEASFETDDETLFFVFNATINERVFVNLTVTNSNNLEPEITILDLSRNQLEQRSSQGSQVRATLSVPRSSPYIVQVRNLNGRRGSFNLQLRRIAVDIDKLPIRPADYNEQYTGEIRNNTPISYFRFSGKAGELVTIEMNAAEGSALLDPYLILADSTLNELIFNDNSSASRAARIAQFALPKDGDYFILATRAGLSRGFTVGEFELEITVGELQLEMGALTATLTWEGEADLNLFMRTPTGKTISWANASIAEGGILQIDSNTGCETPTAQPIEHIYWDAESEVGLGDYTFWVWYQNDCMMSGETAFTLSVTYNGQVVLPSTTGEIQTNTLIVGERFESSIRLADNNNTFVVDSGTITTPSAQQTESDGGDQLIVYGDTITGNISDEVFAEFYQFQGNAGDNIVIIVERVTNNLDPIVILRTDSDVNLALNDDISTTNRNSQIIYTLPTDGRYVISVTRYGVRDGTTTGNYSLSFSRIAAPDLTSDG